MLDLLGERYTKIRQGTIADRYVRAEHVRAKLGHANLNNIADFIALDKYPGVPYGSSLEIHWHEVKVSRSDWLSELKQPWKSEAFTKYAHRSWLVVSEGSIVKPGELPEGWGLMVATTSGLRVKVQAPRNEYAEPVPLDLMISIASAAQRTGARELSRRDAPSAHVGSWDRKCSVCRQLSPCQWHQVREFAEAADERRNYREFWRGHDEGRAHARRKAVVLDPLRNLVDGTTPVENEETGVWHLAPRDGGDENRLVQDRRSASFPSEG